MIIALVILASCSPQNKLNRLTKRTAKHLDKHPELREAFDTTSTTSIDSTSLFFSIDTTVAFIVDTTFIDSLVKVIKTDTIDSTFTRRITETITKKVFENQEFNFEMPILIEAPDTVYKDTLDIDLFYAGGQLRLKSGVKLEVQSSKTTVDITYNEYGTFWIWFKDEKTLFLIALIVILTFGIVSYVFIKLNT